MIRALIASLAALMLGAQVPPPVIDSDAVTAALDPINAPGTILIARGDTILYERAFGLVDPQGSAEHQLGAVWRWASVTKQVTATIAMQEVAAGRLDLDAPITREPLSGFFYGDCDFIMLAAIIETTSGKSYDALIAERIAQPLNLTSVGVFPRTERTVAGYADGKPESSAFRLENFGGAGALYGTTHDLLAYDRALMTGKLLPKAERSVMWDGKPEYGYAALGQWAFSVPLKDCGGTPVRIIERRGFIGGVVLRNIILPDLDMAIIMTSNRAEAEAAYGEIWQQAGITHDVMRAALCATGIPA